MNKFVVVLICLFLLAIAGCSKRNGDDVIYFSCKLSDGTRHVQYYTFQFNQEKQYLFWVEGTQQLKVVRNTKTQLWGEHTGHFRKFSYDSTLFHLNRITGDAELDYAKKPTAVEVSKCEKKRGFGCYDSMILTPHTKIGLCKKVKRRI